MFIIMRWQWSLEVKSEVVGVGGEVGERDGEMEQLFLPSSLPKHRGRKKKLCRAFGEGFFFFSALITGLLSDRSLSKSYKLEGGGWNRDWATLSQSQSLFHFSLHKHATDWKHIESRYTYGSKHFLKNTKEQKWRRTEKLGAREGLTFRFCDKLG